MTNDFDYRRFMYSFKLPIELICYIKEFVGPYRYTPPKIVDDDYEVKFKTRHRKRSFSF